ncbi:MAG: AzlC family ABC transporter permease [Oscillospiraceae bacterium]|nr:AzlC family ABC transporter permease [Oscillospiraceae bacterium]
MDRNALKAAFPHTLPVMAGYLALGIAFGILMDSIGMSVLWTAFSSMAVFAGSAQMLSVSLIDAAAPLLQVAVLTLVLNFRHLFYGLSLIGQYRDTGWRKPYLIFGLTDETYAILTATAVPEGVVPGDFYFAVTLLDQLYWVAGSIIGTVAGSLITFSTEGVDFAMTALFVVLLAEQVKKKENRIPAAIGLAFAAVSLMLVGPDKFLIPALVGITACLLALQGKGSKEGQVSPP